MYSLTIYSILHALAVAVPLPQEVTSTVTPSTEASGLITFISGVLTTPYQCGSYASNNVCATGYSCVDGKCVSSAEIDASTYTGSGTTSQDLIVEPVSSPVPVADTPVAETPVASEAVYVPPPTPEPVYVPPPTPEPVYVPPPPPPPSDATLTFYEPSTGPAFCDEVTYSSSSYVVALSTNILENHCGQTVTITWGGNSVQATVVDQCNVSHGCRTGNIDTTAAVWRALGANMDAGVINVRYHF